VTRSRRTTGPAVSNDTDRMAEQIRWSGGRNRLTGGMRILQYVVGAVLVVALVVASVGWYLSAHPGGQRFESCHWEGQNLVLGYVYGSGDTVSTMVHPDGDHVVAQLRVDPTDDAQTMQALTGAATYPISGGPVAVKYPNGAELNCPQH
jgi:hypothetical protein